MPSLADVRIRTKLGLILIIPVLAILTLTVLRLNDSNNQAQDAAQIGDLTNLSGRATALAHELHKERMAAAAVIVANQGADAKAKEATALAFDAQLARTGTANTNYNNAAQRLDSVPAVVQERLDSIEGLFGTLGNLRNSVTGNGVARVGLPTTYADASFEDLRDAMKIDKKSRGNQLRFVVLDDIGRPRILAGPSDDDLRAAYDAIGGRS